jgi:hypothetical protein
MAIDERRVAFLAFHDEAHAYHFGPILFELAAMEGARVDVFADAPLERLLRTLGERYPPSERLRFLTQERTLAARLRALLRGDWTSRVLPWAHLPRLARDSDAVILPCNYLRRRLKEVAKRWPLGERAAFIFVPHGGTVAAVPFAEGNDFALAYGRAMEAGFREVGLPCREVGYPKLDLPRRPAERLFAEERPTVLYNPHWRVASSWPAWGERVLEHFAGSRDFNLVFAPHVNLFGRKADDAVLDRFRGLPNVHVDVDGPRLLDLSYATVADLYLGDASSQVYELLALRRRPCVFLDPHGLSVGKSPPEEVVRLGSQGRAALRDAWRCGEVVTRLEDLPAALARGLASPSAFQAAQDAALAGEFALNDVPSGRRGAEAILEWARVRRRFAGSP